jgi:YVTN family beta-propeller protein
MRTIASLFVSAALLMAAPKGHQVISKIEIGGEGGWDYLTVDSEARRLYVSHATRVVVVDLNTEKVVGEIGDTQGVHGIALAPKLNRGFISNGRTNDVTVFDLKTLKPIERVKSGENPDAILYDGPSNRVFVFNGRSKDATVLDAATGKVVATIPVGGKPEFSVSDGKGKAWVNIEDTHEIVELDTTKAAVVKRYALTGCDEPSGLAWDGKHRRLFSACANKVMAVSDPAAGKVVASVPIGGGTDGAGFDEALGLAYSSNGEGTLTVVRGTGGKYEVAETIATQQSARTMTIDQKTHKLYLPAAQFGPTPAATAQQPRPRPSALPGSFKVLVVGQP